MDARLITAQKMETVDLLIFTGEILNGKLHFCAVYSVRAQMQCSKIGQKNYCMCFSFLSDKPYNSKNKGRSNRKNDSCNPDIAHSTPCNPWYSHFQEMLIAEPCILSKQKNVLRDSLEKKRSILGEQYHVRAYAIETNSIPDVRRKFYCSTLAYTW